MSDTSTVYDIKVRYAMDDKASKGVKNLAGDTDKAAKSAMSLKGALAAIGGVALLKEAKSAFIDFNSEIDQMKIGLTAVMQMQLKMPFEKARIEADKLFNTFQQLAKKSPATTKDFMEMGSAIAPVVGLLGGGPDQIAKLAQGGVLVSQAFGERADVVGRDIKQMLMGTVGQKDPIAMQLLGSRGIDSTKFNAMKGSERAQLTESMLQDPALLKAADTMGDSLKGQVSTFQDQLQMALGEVGKPLMEEITAEVKKWNTWIEKHPATIKRIGDQLSSMLTQTFTFVRDAATFLVDNSDTLMTLGKIFLVFKGTQIATGAVGNFAKGISSFISDLKDNANKMKGAFGEESGSGILGSIGKVGKGLLGMLPAISAVTVALFEAGSWFKDNVLHGTSLAGTKDEKQGKAVEDLDNTLNTVTDLTKRIHNLDLQGPLDSKGQAKREALIKQLNDPEVAGAVIKALGVNMSKEDFMKKGLNAFVGDGRNVADFVGNGPNSRSKRDEMSLVEQFTATGDTLEFKRLTKQQQETARELFDTIVRWQEYMDPFARADIYDAAQGAYKAPVGKGWSGANTPDVNVTIQKVEVASEDPDRFVFGLVQIAENAVKHPTQSQHTTPGGF